MGLDGALYGTATGGGAHNGGTIFRLTPNGAKWDVTVLHDFFPAADGSYPFGGLVVDTAGAFYGTTYAGTVANRGTVFKLTPGTGGADGGNPNTGLIIDGEGNLYGVATSGGNAICKCGVIYKLPPGASEEVLHTFTFPEGLIAHGPLLRDNSGALYGVAHGGGTDNQGAVYKLTQSGAQWNIDVLNSFSTSNNDGRRPFGGLVFDSAGALYGTTAVGGDFDKGTVYKLTQDANGWTRETLHSFAGAPKDGSGPNYVTLVRETGGTIYGTTTSGGKFPLNGTVFELVP